MIVTRTACRSDPVCTCRSHGFLNDVAPRHVIGTLRARRSARARSRRQVSSPRVRAARIRSIARGHPRVSVCARHRARRSFLRFGEQLKHYRVEWARQFISLGTASSLPPRFVIRLGLTSRAGSCAASVSRITSSHARTAIAPRRRGRGVIRLSSTVRKAPKEHCAATKKRPGADRLQRCESG